MWLLDYEITHVFQVLSFNYYYRSDLKWGAGEVLNSENDGCILSIFTLEKNAV